MPDNDATSSELSYEDARQALAEIVATLEAGSESLEKSLALWERGEQLAAQCSLWLAGASDRLEVSESEAQ